MELLPWEGRDAPHELLGVPGRDVLERDEADYS